MRSTAHRRVLPRRNSAGAQTRFDASAAPSASERSLAHVTSGSMRLGADVHAEPAVDARHDPVTTDGPRVALDPLGHELGVFDVVGLRLDHPGTQDLVVGDHEVLEQPPLVRVSGVGGLEQDGPGLRRPHEVDDVGQVDVVVVGAWIVAPAQVHAQLLGRDVPHGVVERLDVQGGAPAELSEIHLGVRGVPAHGEIGAVELHRGTGFSDRLVLEPHCLGDREEVLLVGRIELVLEEQ